MRRGFRQAPSPREAVEGATVTFVFTDLVGSTQLIERLGDQRSERLIRDHLRRLRSVVEAHRGRVVKSTGDGLMAAFGSSAAAIDCAVGMQQEVDRTGEGAERLGLRVGLHAGEAVYDDGDYYGRAVWIAQRLCDASEAGQITTSEIIKELVGDRGSHRFVSLGPISPKGLTDPIRAYAIEWEGEVAGDHPGSSEPAPPHRRAMAATALVIASAIGIALAWPQERRNLAPEQTDVRSSTGSDPGTTDGDDTKLRLVSARADGSVGDEPTREPVVSGDGSVVAFDTSSRLTTGDGNALSDVYAFELEEEGPLLVSANPGTGEEGNGPSQHPAISEDGRYLAFESSSTNLTSAPVGGVSQIYLYDRAEARLELISLRRNGDPGRGDSMSPSISRHADVIVFASDAPNLAVLNDRNDVRDVFAHRTEDGSTIRVSVGPKGLEADGPSDSPVISANGNFIAYISEATNLVGGDSRTRDVFLWNVLGRTTTKISVGSGGRLANGPSDNPSISGRGTRIAFDSAASNLVAGDQNGVTDVFVAGRSGHIELISTDEEGGPSNGDSFFPQISADGRFVAFVSEASDLVAGDENALPDVFLRDLVRDVTYAVSVNRAGELVGTTDKVTLSADGRHVGFVASTEALKPVIGRDVQAVFIRAPLP